LRGFSKDSFTNPKKTKDLQGNAGLLIYEISGFVKP
jgi:hypothetical protein